MNKDYTRTDATLYVSSDQNASAVRCARGGAFQATAHRPWILTTGLTVSSPVQGRRAEHRLQCVFTQSPDEPASGRSSAVPSTVPSAVPSGLTFG